MRVGEYLKRMCESHGVDQTVSTFGAALASREIDPYAIRLPDLTEAFLGRDYSRAERKLRALKSGNVRALEASEAVDASAFSNITGQLLVTIVKEKYQSADFVTDMMFRTFPNPGGNLKEHKVPYLSDVDSEPAKLAQAEPYPFAKFAESWYTMPAPEKYGHICAVTMEMLFSDLTGQAQDSAASVGRALGYGREKRRLRVALGITENYKWNDSSLSTYVSTETTGKYVNKLLSNTITNWTHINDMEQLFWQMKDPITERKIHARPTTMLCMPEKRYSLKRIINAVETRSGDITTGSGDQVNAPSPLDIQYGILTSAIAQALLDAETSLSASEIKERVYFGDFQRGLGYREVYPLSVEEAPVNNPMEFHQDIVLGVKASEYGVPFVYDPRYIGLSTSEAS
jgi:hypothetical protein